MSVLSRFKLTGHDLFYMVIGLVFMGVMAVNAADAQDTDQIRVCVESESTALYDATTDRLYYNGNRVVGCNEDYDIRVVAVKSENRISEHRTQVNAQFTFFRAGESQPYEGFSATSGPYYRHADPDDRQSAVVTEIHQMVDQKEHRFRIAIY